MSNQLVVKRTKEHAERKIREFLTDNLTVNDEITFVTDAMNAVFISCRDSSDPEKVRHFDVKIVIEEVPF